MVEQMVSSNLSKYGLGDCAAIMTSSDNQPTRDVQNDIKAGPFGNSALQKEEDVVTQPFEAKSPPGSNSNNNSNNNNNNVNRNLVYARRRSDAELSNSRTSDKNRTSGYQQLGDQNHIPHTEAKVKANDSIQSFSRIPVNSAPTRIRNCENEHSAMDNWNSRFVQLQKYLKQCDSSNPEVYLQKLRSFSTDECSRRAVELERRAIQLMLEEGREIQRVKDLNVLGKSATNHPLLRPLTPVFKSEKLV